MAWPATAVIGLPGRILLNLNVWLSLFKQAYGQKRCNYHYFWAHLNSRASMQDIADAMGPESTSEEAMETDHKPAMRDNGDDGKHTEANNIEIPKITPIISSDTNAAQLARGLEGKFVDEFGNILGADGTVHGRAEGDLPSMVGRPIQGNGSILDSDGEACGYVSENLTMPPLQEVGCGLKVDADGHIYDMHGETVGKMNMPEASGQNMKTTAPENGAAKDSSRKRRACEGLPGRRDETGPTPSPSEIYLDVKSTHDGIQLIIKIPTVFNRDQENQ